MAELGPGRGGGLYRPPPTDHPPFAQDGDAPALPLASKWSEKRYSNIHLGGPEQINREDSRK